jgi:hypothetical protein
MACLGHTDQSCSVNAMLVTGKKVLGGGLYRPTSG